MKDRHDLVRVADLKAGDTVLIDGTLRTVCAKDLSRDPLMGHMLWGDSHRLGRDLVTRVTFGAELRRQGGAA